MKKVLIVLIMILCPMIVFADASSPYILGYDAVIINKNGAKVEDNGEGVNKVIAYNTKIHVCAEWKEENKVEATNYKSGINNCDEGIFTIPFKDIAPLKEEVEAKDLLKAKNLDTTLKEVNLNIMVTEKNGVKLKKGPAEIYGQYSETVPYKTVLNIRYAIDYYSPGGVSYSWLYVDNGTYKGWVDNGIGFESDDSMMLFDDLKFYDIDTDEVITTIPTETIIEKYYSHGEKDYFTYKDKLGYVIDSYEKNVEGQDYTRTYQLCGFKSKGYIITLDSIEMNSKGKTISAIPKGEKIKVLYGLDDDSEHGPHNSEPVCIKEKNCSYYVEYNGTKGFIDDSDIVSLTFDSEDENIVTEIESKLYDKTYASNYYYDDAHENNYTLEEYSKMHETGKTVPANTKVTVYAYSYLADRQSDRYYVLGLIKYENNLGWIITRKENDNSQKEEPNKEDPIINDNSKKEEKEKKNRTLTIIIYSIVGAAILSLTALVTIKLINSKKKKNKIETKKEESELVKKEELPKEEKKDNK